MIFRGKFDKTYKSVRPICLRRINYFEDQQQAYRFTNPDHYFVYGYEYTTATFYGISET